MKKYISFLLVGFVIFLTSCSNDDITISRNITFKVDPSGVVKSFTEEIKPGELSSINSGCKLRVKVLAYDKDGLLAYCDSAFLDSYNSQMTSQKYIPEGTYTVIAVTDVVRGSIGNISREYWNMSGVNDINTLKVSYNRWLAFNNVILGVASQKVTIDANSQDIILNPSPAGALFLIVYYNISRFSDVESYKLLTNRSCDYMSFDSNGNVETLIKNQNNQFNWRTSIINIGNETSNNIYDYAYVFPMDNASYKFVARIKGNSEDTDLIEENMVIPSIKAGEEYYFELDLNNLTYDYRKVSNSNSKTRSSNSVLTSTPWMERKKANFQETVMLKDLIRHQENVLNKQNGL